MNLLGTCGDHFDGIVPESNIYTERVGDEDLVSWTCPECDATHETQYALAN